MLTTTVWLPTVAKAAGGVYGLLEPVSVTFFRQALVVTLQIGAFALLSKRKAKVRGTGANAGQPLVHVYVPSTVNEAFARPAVGLTVTPGVSANAICAVRPIAKQAKASAGPHRRAESPPLATRTVGANCGTSEIELRGLSHT